MTSPNDDNSTTAFVANALEQMKRATTEEERREIYRSIYFRVYERLNVLARKARLRPVVPEVMTQDIADGAEDRLEKFFMKEQNEKWRQKMQDINDLMNLAARHMRFFLMDVLRRRVTCKAVTDQNAVDELNLADWLDARLNDDDRRQKPADPANVVQDRDFREHVMLEFWQTFDQMNEIDPAMTHLLEKSVLTGMSNVELGRLERVSESTIRDRLRRARLTFLRLYGKDWPFEN